MADRRSRMLWVAAILALAGGVAVAVIGLSSLQSARDDRQSALASVGDAESRLAAADDDLAVALADQRAATAGLQVAEDGRKEAADAVAAAQDAVAALAAEAAAVTGDTPGLFATAVSYPAAGEAVVAAAEAHLEVTRRLADLRARQADAIATGDYWTFNSLQQQYEALIDDWNDGAAAVHEALAAVPPFALGSLTSAASGGPPAAPVGLAAAVATLDPPTGPARVVGSLPDTIPCTPDGDGCRWEWEITWTETNALLARITRLGLHYVDRRGTTWIFQSGEWWDADHTVQPLGSASFDNWVRSDPDDEGDLQGGTVVIMWEGVDADGNEFSGRATAVLASRDG